MLIVSLLKACALWFPEDPKNFAKWHHDDNLDCFTINSFSGHMSYVIT